MIVKERERGRDTGRGRSRLHAPGTRRGIRSRVSKIAPWAKGRRQTAAPPRDPFSYIFIENTTSPPRGGEGNSEFCFKYSRKIYTESFTKFY